MRIETGQAGANIELENVRGGEEGHPVQLCSDEETGRLIIRGVNEGGFACVDIDFDDLVRWISRFLPEPIDATTIAAAARQHSGRHDLSY